MAEREPARSGIHILLIHQLFVSGGEAGGTRHFELARHLANAGDRISVLTSSVSYLTGERHGTDHPHDPESAIRLRRCATYTPSGSGFVGRVASFLSFMATSFFGGLRTKEVDVVWGTTPPIFQAATALLVARVKRVPFVLEVRDLWPDFAVELGVLRSPLLIRLSRWLERTLYRSAAAVVVNSPGFISHVGSYTDRDRIALVPNGTEVEAFRPEDRGLAIREELGLENEVVALYAGAHGVPNDLDVVLDAAVHLADRQDIVFVFVGDGRDRARLELRAADLGLGNARFVPAQPKSRMPDFLAAADVCIAILKPLPMFATVYPNKVFDYMAAGRPTVLAIDGVIREVVEAAGAGRFVQPGDALALSEAVRVYADDPRLRSRDGGAGRAYVSAHFRRETHAEELRRTFLDLAGSVPART